MLADWIHADPNPHRSHQRALADHKRADVIWFIHGWTLERFLLFATVLPWPTVVDLISEKSG